MFRLPSPAGRLSSICRRTQTEIFADALSVPFAAGARVRLRAVRDQQQTGEGESGTLAVPDELQSRSTRCLLRPLKSARPSRIIIVLECTLFATRAGG